MNRRVAIYARVSTEHEAQINALENQIQYYDDIMSKHEDWTLYNRYVDKGITGTSVYKRESFMKMLEDANNGCFDLIITREISRFARNTEDTLREVRKLRRKNIEVFFIEDNIWSIQDDEADLKITLYSAFAENESRKTSVRVKAGQKISFENGVFYGTGNILGYDRVGKEMVINEEQAKTVKLIFDLYLQGNGTRKIQFELEKLGYLTATGLKKWSSSAIVRILRNPFYCGTIVYRKQYVPDFLEQKAVKNHGEVEQVTVEGKHQPIISKEVFQRAQELLEENSVKPSTDNNSSDRGRGKKSNCTVWGKKLVCRCGSSLNRKVYHKYKDGHRTYCYQCYDQIRTGTIQTRLNKGLDIEGICDSMLMPEWKLQLISKKVFEILWKDKDKIIEITNNLLDSVVSNVDKDKSNIIRENYNKQKDELKLKIDKLLDTYLNNIIEKEYFIKKKEEYDNTIKEIDIKLEELKDIKPVKEITVQEKLLNLKNTIEKSINYENNVEELIDNLIDKIIVHNNVISWKLKIYDIMKKEEGEEEQFVLLTKLAITSDDIKRFGREENIKVNSKNPIYVNIYM